MKKERHLKTVIKYNTVQYLSRLYFTFPISVPYMSEWSPRLLTITVKNISTPIINQQSFLYDVCSIFDYTSNDEVMLYYIKCFNISGKSNKRGGSLNQER